MKKIVYLFCLFSILSSCKQTQPITSFNKSSKIYLKPATKSHYTDVKSIKDKAVDYSKRKPFETFVKNSFNSVQIANKEELLANVDVYEPSGFLKENKLQKLIGTDSVLKSQILSLQDHDEILNLSKKAKKFSFVSLTGTLLSAFLTESNFDSLTTAFSLVSFILALIGLKFLIRSIKKINSKGEKIKQQNKKIRKNIRTVLFILPLLILSLAFIIYVMLFFSISIGSIVI